MNTTTPRIMPLDRDLPLTISPARENGHAATVMTKVIRDADGAIFNPMVCSVCRPTSYETNLIAERLAKLWRCRHHIERLDAMLTEQREKGVSISSDDLVAMAAEIRAMTDIYMAGGVH